MSTRKKEIDRAETSVNVALRELMGLEDERRRKEELERLRLEEEAQRALEEERAAQRRLEEESRRLEEEARLARERAGALEEERRRREEQEREIAIRAREEAAANAREQARLLELELSARRIEASKKPPGWFWPSAAALVLCSIGVSTAVYLTVSASAKSSVDSARRDMEVLRASSSEAVGEARSLAEKAEHSAAEARRQLDELRRINSELSERNRQLQIASAADRKPRPRQSAPGAPVEEKDKLRDIVGCTDPLGCGGELDVLPLDIGKKKHR